MQIEYSDRGFEFLITNDYPDGKPARLLSQSSAIGEYEDSFERPGSSFLWVGDNHHLNREEVEEMIQYMQNWLETGKMKPVDKSES